MGSAVLKASGDASPRGVSDAPVLRVVRARSHLTGLSIRAWREEHGLSGRALARLAGIDAMTLFRIERGEQEITSRSHARLAAALELPEHILACAAHAIEPGSFEELRDLVPWEADEYARAVVAMFPDGLTGEQVAEMLHMSPAHVDLVQARGLAKLRASAQTNAWRELVLARVAAREAIEAAQRGEL